MATSESDFLTGVVMPYLESIGWAVQREVSFLLPTADGGCIKRRCDLYLTPAYGWPHAWRWPRIAVEGKKRDISGMGDQIDGLLQTRSCLYGHTFRSAGRMEQRPSLALYVDQETWAAEGADQRDLMLADRILWREGCAILYGPNRWGRSARFTFATIGSPQATYPLDAEARP